MEAVTLLFCQAAARGLLSPIGRCSQVQRLSIFADDVVVFVKPTVRDLVTVRELLKIFGDASGLRVNYNKTAATLIRGAEVERELVSTILTCQITDFPIRYLGLQLALKPLTRAQWQPMIDAAVRIAPPWQRGLITKAGRVVLVQAVMTARPIHHLLVAEAPAWVLEEIEKGLRGFLWAAKDKANGGQCLVAWDQVCRPREFGGLGIRNLRLQGLALRMRWEWLRRTDNARPWQGLPMLKDEKAREAFDSLVKIDTGSGRSVLFWRDRWIHGCATEDFAPGITQHVKTRVRNTRTMEQAMRGNAWLLDIQGCVATLGARECVRLWLAISSTRRDPSVDDVFRWPWSSSGAYTASSAYEMLAQGCVRFELADAIWRSHATPKSKLFIWLAAQHRIWTSDRRARHGLQDAPSPCYICLQEEDTAEHILVRCVYAREIWWRCCQRLGMQFQTPDVSSSLREWWTKERGRFRAKERRWFDGLVCTVGHALWKQRNAWCFANVHSQHPAETLVAHILEELRMYRVTHDQGVGVLDNG
jgi:hypothetical protein